MEKSAEEVVSTQKVLSSGHDPGWNDPPKWTLSSKSDGTPTKRLLNKRVPFPMNSKQEISRSLSNQIIPPVGNTPPYVEVGNLSSVTHTSSIVPTNDKFQDMSSNEEINEVLTLKDTVSNLNCVMEEMEPNRADEIKKRLSRMEAMWNEDKLSSSIKNTLFKISNALKADDVEKADQLHILLVMHDASVCSSWIPGIRQLIAEIKNKNMINIL